jgi:hypothetical protein
MAQSGKGSVVSFQREQGFGKVNVGWRCEMTMKLLNGIYPTS